MTIYGKRGMLNTRSGRCPYATARPKNFTSQHCKQSVPIEYYLSVMEVANRSKKRRIAVAMEGTPNRATKRRRTASVPEDMAAQMMSFRVSGQPVGSPKRENYKPRQRLFI